MREGRDWGLDPAVRDTREVFGLMERRQRELLESLGITPFDARLRRWRDQARTVFEREWAEAARSGRTWGAAEAAGAYVRSLARVLSDSGVHVATSTLPVNEDRS